MLYFHTLASTPPGSLASDSHAPGWEVAPHPAGLILGERMGGGRENKQSRLHVHTCARVQSRGCTGASVRQQTEWDMCLNREHLRDRACQQNQSCDWASRLLSHRGPPARVARPCVSVIRPWWAHGESSFWRKASLRNGHFPQSELQLGASQ